MQLFAKQKINANVLVKIISLFGAIEKMRQTYAVRLPMQSNIRYEHSILL